MSDLPKIGDNFEPDQISDGLCSLCHEADELRNNCELASDNTQFSGGLSDETIVAELNELEQATKSLSKVSLHAEFAAMDDVITYASQDLMEAIFPDALLVIENDDKDTNEPSRKKLKTNSKSYVDKGVQTEKNSSASGILSVEQPEEPTNNKGTSQMFESVVMKTPNVPKPDYNAINSAVTNRHKQLVELANDIYCLSTYLDGIRKAMKTPESSTAPVNIPSPPSTSNFDSQFDFPNQTRFSKLPILVESCGNTKPITNNSGSNSKSRGRTPKTKTTIKRLNNATNTSKFSSKLPTRQMKQTTITEAFSADKENKVSNIRKDVSIKKTLEKSSVMKEKTKVKLCDSDSMYNYNPLKSKSKKNTQKIPKTK